MPRKTNPHVEKIDAQLNLLNARFTLITRLFYGLVLINIVVVSLVQYNNYRSANVNIVSTNGTQLAIKAVIKKDYQLSINSFYNNSAISEVAFQLELKKQSVSTNGTTNCFTPDVPPLQNGCSFVVRPYAAGITRQGTILNRLIFSANMNSGDKFVIDIKDTDKNEITSNLGIIRGRDSIRSIDLPARLSAKEQVLVRFWPQRGSVMTVNEILVEYFNIEQLQPVTLNLPKAYPGAVLKIYQDYDLNGVFDAEADRLWNCNRSFAGVLDTVLNSDTHIKLLRDDGCMTQDIPSKWISDKGVDALPPYKWIGVVFQNNKVVDNFPFELNKGENSIDLKAN